MLKKLYHIVHVSKVKGRWVAKLVRQLARQLSGFESRHLSKIQNVRHKQGVANTLSPSKKKYLKSLRGMIIYCTGCGR
jgi:hypothetical protein